MSTGGIFAGGISTGIYLTNSADSTEYVIEHSRANIVVVEEERYLEQVLPLLGKLPHLKAIVQYTGGYQNQCINPHQ